VRLDRFFCIKIGEFHCLVISAHSLQERGDGKRCVGINQQM
jgi:hypothetical protein